MIQRDVHVRSLETSISLSSYYMPHAIMPLEVIALLNAAQIKFMLVGAHGIGGWMKKPRATEDVDVVVATRHQKKATRILLAAFKNLEAEDFEVVTRLRDRDTKEVAIDLMKQNQPLFRVALKHTHTVKSGRETYSIPSLEFALTMKFASMISLNRSIPDRHLDAHDFGTMIRANSVIDLEKLADLGDLVYPDGGKEIVEKCRQVRAGEKWSI